MQARRLQGRGTARTRLLHAARPLLRHLLPGGIAAVGQGRFLSLWPLPGLRQRPRKHLLRQLHVQHLRREHSLLGASIGTGTQLQLAGYGGRPLRTRLDAQLQPGPDLRELYWPGSRWHHRAADLLCRPLAARLHHLLQRQPRREHHHPLPRREGHTDAGVDDIHTDPGVRPDGLHVQCGTKVDVRGRPEWQSPDDVI